MEPRLVTFLYILMRDHLPAGVVEELYEADFETYSNLHLARYAHEIAKRLVKR